MELQFEEEHHRQTSVRYKRQNPPSYQSLQKELEGMSDAEEGRMRNPLRAQNLMAYAKGTSKLPKGNEVVKPLDELRDKYVKTSTKFLRNSCVELLDFMEMYKKGNKKAKYTFWTSFPLLALLLLVGFSSLELGGGIPFLTGLFNGSAEEGSGCQPVGSNLEIFGISIPVTVLSSLTISALGAVLRGILGYRDTRALDYKIKQLLIYVEGLNGEACSVAYWMMVYGYALSCIETQKECGKVRKCFLSNVTKELGNTERIKMVKQTSINLLRQQ